MDRIEENYQKWLNSANVSATMKAKLLQMSPEEKVDAFFKDIEFGTAGMRGVLGPGTNRLNEFTLTKANVAFAQYLLNRFPKGQQMGVVIAHDNRHMSREFTLQTAATLNRYGFKTYIFDSLRPTPELSFAVRHLHTCAGIMITASHNPKEHNGYKIYDEQGCQLVPEKIAPLLEIIETMPDVLDVFVDELLPHGENILLSSEVDEAYIKAVLDIQINRDLPVKNYKIVFSPQHGASYTLAMRIFDSIHYHVIPVASQCDPDPDFKGTLTPNPEDPRAYIEPIKLAKMHQAELVLITDPDADRVGVAYRKRDGSYDLLNGNQSAAILLDYVLSQRQQKGLLSKHGAMYSTIVTSSFGKTIAESYGLTSRLFLTGFKFIGSQIQHDIENNGPNFEFGYEESYGCLIAPFVRDKDALQALVMYSEMACYYHQQGLHLDEVYENLCLRFGYHVDMVHAIEFKGLEGANRMVTILKELRENPPKEILNRRVMCIDDYLLSTHTCQGVVTPIDLPKSDVIKLTLEDQSTIIVRPSGTEPKCKFYYGIKGNDKEKVTALPDLLHQEVLRLIRYQ